MNQSQGQVQTSQPNGDVVVPSCPNDTVSSLSFSPNSSLMCAGSWNKDVCIWNIQQNGYAAPVQKMTHNAPVLCTAWFSDGRHTFSGSCDNSVRMWNIQMNQHTVVAMHQAPVKECFWLPEVNALCTGSWDRFVKYWDLRNTNGRAVLEVQQPERIYCMASQGSLMVVGTADRQLLMYDIRKAQQPFRQFQSPLKYQSRCIACFPDMTGFALGSIEGRVAISYVDQRDHKKNFAFKCHRQSNEVYAVNSISFHPRFSTFATCGSDGTYVFWDKDSKQRLKMFNRYNNTVSCSAFNADGRIFAYSVGYDWSRGAEYYDKMKGTQIYLHAVQDNEIQPRGPQGH